MSHKRFVPFTTHMHDSDPGWDCVGDVIEYDDEEEDMVFEQDGEYLTEENNTGVEPAPLTVERVGDEAHIPWGEWTLLVKALHNIGICLPPHEEEG